MRRQMTFLAVLSASLLLGAQANAGSANLSTGDNNSMTFEYNDADQVRVTIPSMENGFILVRDNTIYTVANYDGNPVVMDMRELMKLGQSMPSESMVPSTSTGKVISLEPAQYNGKSTETLAGIVGKVYKMRYIDADDREQETIMVLSDDPRALELRDAMLTMGSAMLQATGQSGDHDNDLRNTLEARDMGILRWGEELKVTTISDQNIASTRFDLPAQPTSLGALGGLGAMFGGAADDTTVDESESEEASGGLFSSMMNAVAPKADRQQDRVEQKTNNAVDEKTDEAVDKVLDKAFGKIFGN